MGFVAVGTAWGFKVHSPATTFDSGQTVDTWIPFINESISKTFETLEVVDSQSRYMRANGGPLGRITVEGDVTTYVEPENIGYLLYYLLGDGAVSSGTPVVGTVTHDFTPANEIPYFTSEFKYGTVTDSKGKRAYNCKMKGATFDFAEDMLTATWNIQASDYSGHITTVAISNPTGRKFTYKDLATGTLTTKVPGIVVEIGGTTTSGVKIKSGSLSVDNGLITDDYYQGSQEVQQLDAGKFSVNGSFELQFDNATTLNSWLDGSEDATVTIQYEGDVITGSTPHTLKFVIPNAWVTNHEIAMTNNEVIVRQVEFAGFYDSASTPNTLKISLINGVNGTGYE